MPAGPATRAGRPAATRVGGFALGGHPVGYYAEPMASGDGIAVQHVLIDAKAGIGRLKAIVAKLGVMQRQAILGFAQQVDPGMAGECFGMVGMAMPAR